MTINHSEINLVNPENIPQKLPSFSIVIPTYNGAKTLGRTIESLLDQNYPDLEIIVIDGNSTDESIDIIKQYETHLSYWISEPDKGQSNAINKGFARCSGDIINWLCSDDILVPKALYYVGKIFQANPQVDVVAGCCRTVFLQEKEREFIKQPTPKNIALMPAINKIGQPSCFYRRQLLDRPQPIDESYHYTMDSELWAYFNSKEAKWKCIDEVLSIAFQDGNNKSETGGYEVTLEIERLYKNYYSQELIPLTFWHRKLRFPLERIMADNPNNILFYISAFIWVMVSLFLAPFYGFQKVWEMRWKRWA